MKFDWDPIVNATSLLNPDAVNQEKIKNMLTFDRSVDVQVLDNLYIARLLPLEDYIKFMIRHIEYLKESLQAAEDRLSSATNKGIDYDPMVYYGWGRVSYGTAIENELQN